MPLFGPSDGSSPTIRQRLSAVKRGPAALMIAGIVILASTGAYAVYAEDDMPTCHADAAILAYPRYSNKGLIEKYTYRCGEPDRSCRLREHGAKGPVYDCSPFALGGKTAIL